MSKTARDSASTVEVPAKRYKFTIDADIPFLPYEMYHIMAQYYSKDLTEQMDFLEAISNSDELQFSSVTKLFSLEHTADITDAQWMNYKPLLTSSPNNLKITKFTKDTRELQRILISCPNLTTLTFKVARFNDCYFIVFPTGLTTLHLDFFGAKTIAYSMFSYIFADTPKLSNLYLSNFNGSVNDLKLPSNLRILNFGDYFDYPVNELVLPSNLSHLEFGNAFNQPVDKLVFPSFLIHLKFGDAFDQPVDKLVLPSNLKYLEFGDAFNHPVDQLVFPPKLTKFRFGNAFDQPVDKLVLPSNLLHLEFGDAFDHPVNELGFPLNLEYLKFGNNFNQDVDVDKVVFPPNLLYLKFGNGFNPPINDVVLPPNLQTIEFGDAYAECVYKHHYGDILIPKTVTNFTLGYVTFKFV